MMNRNSNSKFAPLLAAMAMAASVAAWAQSDAMAPLPAEKHHGSVSYLSGGVPDEQLPAIKQARGGYPLVIELYQKAGAKSEYTSGAQVRLTDKAGNVLIDDVSDGPFMLVRLPPGSYRVQATLNGKMVEAKSVAVAAKGSKRAVIVFPQGTD